MSRPLVSATFILVGTVAEVRVNGVSATPAWWAGAAGAGRVDLDAFVVRGWNRIELHVERARPRREDEEPCAELSFYRLEPGIVSLTETYRFGSWSMHPTVDLEPIGLGRVYEQRFWAGEDFPARSFEATLGFEERHDAMALDRAQALHAALVSGDLRTFAAAYAQVLDEVADAEVRRRDAVEEEWLARWADVFSDDRRVVEPFDRDAVSVERNLGGRVGVVRRRDGRPAIMVRSEATILGLSPAFARGDGGVRLVR